MAYTQQEWESFLEKCYREKYGDEDREVLDETEGKEKHGGNRKRAHADSSTSFDWARFLAEEKGTRKLRKEQEAQAMEGIKKAGWWPPNRPDKWGKQQCDTYLKAVDGEMKDKDTLRDRQLRCGVIVAKNKAWRESEMLWTLTQEAQERQGREEETEDQEEEKQENRKVKRQQGGTGGRATKKARMMADLEIDMK